MFTDFRPSLIRATLTICLSCLAFTMLTCNTHADNWPQWRGPQFNGASPAESDLPTEWSREQNITWSTELPGPSAATPVIWNDHVFVSSSDPEREKLVAICIDRKSGKIKWQKDVDDGIEQDSRSNYASPSPVTNGEVVVFFYGNGTLVAFDFAGEQLWRHDIQKEYGKFAFMWTFSSSPVLYKDKLYLQVLQRDVPVGDRGERGRENESYLLAFNPKTGEELWKHVRPSQAKQESRESFATPMPYEVDGTDQLLIVGGDDITGHDLETGEELWRWGTWNPTRIGHWRHVPSPIAGGETVLVCAPKRDPVYAIRLGGEGKLNDDAIRWTSADVRSVSSDVPTPAFYDGDFFLLSDVRKAIMRISPDTGEVIWETRTPGNAKYEASPTVADGKIYTINFDGDVVIFDAETGKLINNISMDEPSEELNRSTIAVSNGQLFIRTNRKLYCVGK